MDELRPILVLAAQADGLTLNAVTLAIVSAMVLALVGAITALFKMVTSNQQKQIDKLMGERDAQIDKLTGERDMLLDKLLDTIRTADRSTDAAEEAARLLTDRRAPRKR